MSSRVRLDLAVGQIEFARQYTRRLIADVERDEWFVRPAGAPTHLAWQVGHLAMAEYALTMLRLRGKEPDDEALISKEFFRRFQKGSTPGEPDNIAIDQILATWDRVHARALDELRRYSDADLDEPLPEPHAVFATKLGSVLFCSAHEMLHAGQIGLLRRLLGKPPRT